MRSYCIENTNGTERPRGGAHVRTLRILSAPVEKYGEAKRDRLMVTVRDGFMSEKNLDRDAFDSLCSTNRGYKEYRKYAASRGLQLPA